VDEQLDFSVAVAVEIDESRSMRTRKRDATRMMAAVVEPLDQLGAAVMAAGFRNGTLVDNPATLPIEDIGGCHRIHGVHHDVFKTWSEPFRVARHRFANVVAEGSTPMADGIQFALDEISDRPEGFRFVIVITDGAPNAGHAAVIKRQERLAEEAGIHIIGVGVGSRSHRVKNIFKDFVHAPVFSEAPKKLIAKLNDIVDHKILARRGRRIAKTG
jgi:cobalamin biosynthesis protein CobT